MSDKAREELVELIFVPLLNQQYDKGYKDAIAKFEQRLEPLRKVYKEWEMSVKTYIPEVGQAIRETLGEKGGGE